MCALFVASSLPTRETIQRCRPILVRRTRVKTVIEFLVTKNQYYEPSADFTVSMENLDCLLAPGLEEDVPASVDIAVLKDNDAIEVLTSDYTERNEAHCHATDDVLIENVGFTDGDNTPASFNTMKTIALRHCLSGKPFLASGKGTKAVPDFNNPAILTWLFPHLDPWGIGGFHHPRRKIAISMEEQLSYLLRQYDSQFQADPEFAFVFYNVVRKAQVSRSMWFSVPYRTHRKIIDDLLDIDPAILEKLEKKCSLSPAYSPETEEEKRVFRLIGSLGMLARSIPGSDGYKIMMRNKIRAMIIRLGIPALFITINPSDVDNPIVRLLSGEDINLEDMSRGEDLNEWSHKILAARNVSACALFFHLMISKFIKVILRHGRDEPGAYGKCIGYYGTVEAQGKGTLHCHMLIWLSGHLSPQLLREKLTQSEEYRNQYKAWLESVIRCEFPRQTEEVKDGGKYATRTKHTDHGDPHPGVVASLPVDLFRSRSAFWDYYYDEVDRLINAYNWHEHHATCWKHLQPHEERNDKNCRVGMDGTTHQKTVFDIETLALLLRRHHPWIASYTDLAMFLMKCNFNIKNIGSGEEAKAYIYYVTDYITKCNIPVSHVCHLMPSPNGSYP